MHSKKRLVIVMTMSICIISSTFSGEMNTQIPACFAATSKDPVAIYEDALTVGWTTTGSWSSATTAQNAPGGQYGNYALRTDFSGNWGGVEFRTTGALVDTATHGFASFRIRKEDANGGIYITARKGDATIGRWVPLSSYLVYHQSSLFTPRQWYSVRVPFADMGIAFGTLIQGVIFESATPTTIYLDEIILLDGLSLTFPLQYNGWTPYTATIASVFDHSMTKTYDRDTNDSITAWTGEIGNGTSAPTDYTCKQKSVSDPYGPTFLINGHFNSGCTGVGGGTTYISYQGHPGIDYPVPMNQVVYAAAAGTIITIDCTSNIWGSCVREGSGFGRIIIQHSNGYATWYQHLDAQYGGLAAGSIVVQGQPIGYSGKTSIPSQPVGPHLHFQITTGPHLNDTPIDPYGWDGWYSDPYISAHQHVFNSRQWQ